MNAMAKMHPPATDAAPIPALRQDARPDEARPTLLHFIASIDGGGAEAMLRSLVERADRRRWRVVVVALDARPWPAASAFLTAQADGFHDLEATAFLRKPTLQKLAAVLRTERPAIVQTWMHHADLVGGLVARWVGVRRVVWSLHCREIHRSPGDSPMKMWLLRRALGAASRILPARIVSCSKAAMEDHERLGYPASKMRWIPNGIDADRFVPSVEARERLRSELGIPEAAPVIGFIGRFHEMKDLGTLFAAITKMQACHPEAHFLLCGGTAADLDATTHQQWRELRFMETVHFVPFRPDPESLYPAMDVFTLTSRTEACPMTILEAMSCGVPCVTSDVGDCARLMADLGRVVPPRDADGFQQAWSSILALPDAERRDLQDRLRARVTLHFTIERAAAAYAELYEECHPSPAS